MMCDMESEGRVGNNLGTGYTWELEEGGQPRRRSEPLPGCFGLCSSVEFG